MKGITLLAIAAAAQLFCYSAVSAQNVNTDSRSWWYTLERGKQMFRRGDYGNALLTFEDARRQRSEMYSRMERAFIDLLSLSEVRRLDDSLDWVERYIREQRYDAAGAALEELYYRVPKERFGNSASAALAAFSSLKSYPEAEQWIGETYFVEGELSLALTQFQKAYELRELYENPGYAAELLYKIAAIRRTRQEYNEMERTLLSILSGDSLWSGEGGGEALRDPGQDAAVSPVLGNRSGSFVKQAMTRTLENNGINRFLSMYRYNNAVTERAHRELGFFYYTSGRHSRAAEHLMFAFLMQNTVIIDDVIRRRFDYSFTTLDDLAREVSRNEPVLEFIEQTDYYKTAYCLATSLYGGGKTQAAVDIWTFLSAQTAAGEWRNRAADQLKNPHVERPLEMP